MKIYSIAKNFVSKKFKLFNVHTSYVGSWREEPYFDSYSLKKSVTYKVGVIPVLKYKSKINENDYPYLSSIKVPE